MVQAYRALSRCQVLCFLCDMHYFTLPKYQAAYQRQGLSTSPLIEEPVFSNSAHASLGLNHPVFEHTLAFYTRSRVRKQGPLS